MRRLTTADKISVGFQYLDGDNRELGRLRYNLIEGYFPVCVFPKHFSILKKIEEYIRLLRLAAKLVSYERV